MTKLMTAVCVAGLMGTVAAAQMPMDKMDKGKMAKDKMGKAITVTGCVAAGTDAEHFTFANGMLPGEKTGKPYDLMGGELKAHVGHTVAVTGTLETGTMPAKGKMEMGKEKMPMEKGEHGMAKDKMAAGTMAAAGPHTALHVTSVKMVSASCP